MLRRIILSWFSLFLPGLFYAMPCYASGSLEKLDRLDSNMEQLLRNVQGYQVSLSNAKNDLKLSREQLTLAGQELAKLRDELTRSQAECDQTRQLLENANSLLTSYEKSMKAKMNKQRRQKYLYVVLSAGAIIYAKSK